LASFRLRHRVIQTCSFAEASPKNSKILAALRYIISVNALGACEDEPELVEEEEAEEKDSGGDEEPE
jgi:hypothetical protein